MNYISSCSWSTRPIKLYLLQHYDYDDEQTAAECTQEYDNNHWCYYHLHYSAHNHQTRQFKLDFTQFPTLESVMESFQQTAELFDVSTGKPDDTWSEKFYAVVRFCIFRID